MNVKSLAKDTAIYGLSSILGKFINWCLVPYYTYKLSCQADYGIVTHLYSWTALLVVILTYGMETGLFRFLNKGEDKVESVYGTALTSVFTTSLLFALTVSIFCGPISSLMGYGSHPEFIKLLAIVVSMDAFAAIPFAYLRYKKRPVRFAVFKLLFVALNVLLNLFFFSVCPRLNESNPSLVSWFYDPSYGVGYVFVANIIATTIQTLCLLPSVFDIKLKFDGDLLRRMLRYSLPLLLLGVVGIMNQTIDKMIFPYLYPIKEEAQAQLGIYGACFKVAMVMMMFTQAFRYAYEPFVFAQSREKDSNESYAISMKWFLITSFLIFLGITFYIDILKYIIEESYWVGLSIVPVVLIAYIFQGVYFNLSFWYKLNDKTQYGAIMSLIGLVVNVALLITLIPVMGYMGAALSSLVTFFVMMLVSYFWGQKYLYVRYDFKSILSYLGLALLLYAVSYLVRYYVADGKMLITLGVNTILIIIYLLFLYFKEIKKKKI